MNDLGTPVYKQLTGKKEEHFLQARLDKVRDLLIIEVQKNKELTQELNRLRREK